MFTGSCTCVALAAMVPILFTVNGIDELFENVINTPNHFLKLYSMYDYIVKMPACFAAAITFVKLSVFFSAEGGMISLLFLIHFSRV